MRTINVCLVLLFLTIGLTNSFDFASLNEIQSLKQNSFASSLIETISLSLSASKGEDASEVLSMLNNLNSQLESDQEADDKTFSAKNLEFQNHIDQLTEEINKLAAEIKDLQARIAELAGLIEAAENNIRAFEERVQNLKSTLIDMERTFEADKKYYEEKIASLEVMKVKLSEVTEKLREMIGSVSGVNKFEHIAATESEKRDIAWKEAQKSFLQIKKVIPSNLLELTMNADQGALQKLLEILETISEDVSKEIVAKRTYLDNLESTYEDLVKQMHEEIDLNENAKQKQLENKTAYENEKAEKENEKTEKEARKAGLEKEREINVDLQSQLKSTHDKEAQDRKKEIGIVNVLLGIVQKRLVK